MHATRLYTLNQRSIDSTKPFVLYWMTSARRPHYNFGLEHAIALANQHGVGLVVFEGLRMDYRWTCERFHAFVQEGMLCNKHTFTNSKAIYIPYLETSEQSIKEVLWALINQSLAVVTDYFPHFSCPK